MTLAPNLQELYFSAKMIGNNPYLEMNVKKPKGRQWTAEMLQSFHLSFEFYRGRGLWKYDNPLLPGQKQIIQARDYYFSDSGTWKTVLYCDNYFFNQRICTRWKKKIFLGISGPLKRCKALAISSPAVCFGEPSLITHRVSSEWWREGFCKWNSLSFNVNQTLPTSNKQKIQSLR